MKRKNLAMLLFAATLGLGSCNDVQDLSLDFGDRTYINDYKGLIDAVNNLNLSLKERMDALSQLMKADIEDIKVSIDANTGAIKIVGQNIITLDGDIKEGLSAINTSIFNGFQAVCTQIDATGNTIVAALDNNGNLLRLQIDSIGKLISAQLVTSTKDLIDAMKENNTSLAEKLGLIDAAIKTGFASTAQGQKDIKDAVKEAIATLAAEVKAGNKSNEDALKEIKAAVTSQTTSLETKLAAIETANKEGLATLAQKNDLINATIAALNESVKSQTVSIEKKLADIETATKNGLATLAQKNDLIDASIKALAAEVKTGNKSNEDALKEIKAAVTAQTTSLETKLAAIETANKEGLATLAQKNDLMKTAVDALAAEVKAGNKSNEDALKEIKTIIGSQTTELSTKIAAVESAVNNGLADEKTALGDLKTAIDNFKGSQDAKMGQIITALADLKTQSATNTSELTKMIEETAYSNGITLPSDFPNKVTMAPSAYEAMMTEKKLTGSSATEAALLSKLNLNVQTPITNQMVYVGSNGGNVLYPNGSATGHTCFKATQTGHAPEQIAANLVTDASGKEYYEVYKTEEWVDYTFTLSSGCTWAYLKLIEYKDARGTTQQIINSHEHGGTWTNLRVYYIHTKNGKTTVCVNPEANAWCIYYNQSNIADYDNK